MSLERSSHGTTSHLQTKKIQFPNGHRIEMFTSTFMDTRAGMLKYSLLNIMSRNRMWSFLGWDLSSWCARNSLTKQIKSGTFISEK